MKRALLISSFGFVVLACLLTSAAWAEDAGVFFKGGDGPGAGKHVVLIAGDEEYRSEESMPMLAKILAKRHGFDCTVLFSINPEDGTIDPLCQTNIPGLEKLANADLMIIATRFRALPDAQMKLFDDYVQSGKPIIGLRTATHAFKFGKDVETSYRHYDFKSEEWPGGFGQQVLGETWINHHGHHKYESCRGVVNEPQKDNPILKGVEDVWCPSDVYGIKNLGDDATVLLWGQVLEGMQPTDKPVENEKNDPMMPIAWTRGFTGKSGKTSRIFCTTTGASIDLACKDLRRLVVNAAYWCVGLEDEIPARSNVDTVGPYEPTFFGFGQFTPGLKPLDVK